MRKFMHLTILSQTIVSETLCVVIYSSTRESKEAKHAIQPGLPIVQIFFFNNFIFSKDIFF